MFSACNLPVLASSLLPASASLAPTTASGIPRYIIDVISSPRPALNTTVPPTARALPPAITLPPPVTMPPATTPPAAHTASMIPPWTGLQRPTLAHTEPPHSLYNMTVPHCHPLALSLVHTGTSRQVLPAGEVLNVSMVIDGGPPTFFVPGIQLEAVTTNNLIFNSGDLSEGNHTLVVTAENNHTVWTDYFLVTPNSRPSTSNLFPLMSGPSNPSTTSTTASTILPKTGRSTPIGIIVGLVVGGLILVALGAAAVLLFSMVEIIESTPAAPWQRSYTEMSSWLRSLSSEGHSPTISISTRPPLISTGYSTVSPDANIPALADSIPQRSMTNEAPLPTGILPSNKLARETEQWNNYLHNCSGLPSDEDGPPQYSEC
ncbi:hypothetical protein DFH08DRAFT_992323 [Mycena albidolilacea]|uniref:Transmembrane protein n=1 Tax=Mycena albidolilacea TaxID=1033008 RepID=A0AAD7A791_9AGAR|nr:hypothetical protein DFH08DRAFT_992323 [Mycena albidolilacea]